jgi:abortive infection bacteriophage resistance protein
MKFKKPPFTHEQQLDQVIQRGLACADRAEALHYLGYLIYYRPANSFLKVMAN